MPSLVSVMHCLILQITLNKLVFLCWKTGCFYFCLSQTFLNRKWGPSDLFSFLEVRSSSTSNEFHSPANVYNHFPSEAWVGDLFSLYLYLLILSGNRSDLHFQLKTGAKECQVCMTGRCLLKVYQPSEAFFSFTWMCFRQVLNVFNSNVECLQFKTISSILLSLKEIWVVWKF